MIESVIRFLKIWSETSEKATENTKVHNTKGKVKGENSMEFGVMVTCASQVLTIALALTTKNVFISLLIGILTGNLVLNHFAVLQA